MNSIANSGLSFLNDDMQSRDGISSYKSTQRLILESLKKETQDITLTTKEGDTVMISAFSQTKSSYMGFDYTELVKGKMSSAKTETGSASTENEFEMTVKGDLNEEEMADIKKIIGQLDQIMNDLVSGDMKSVIPRAMGVIDNTDTISGLSAVLKYEQKVSVEQSLSTRVTGDNLLSEVVAKITDQIKEVIDKSKVDPEKLKKPIQNMFAEMMDKLSAKTQQDTMKSRLLEQVSSSLQNMLKDYTKV
jgi:hypothetical protein